MKAIVGCSESAALARKTAGKLGWEYIELETGMFPDGEIHTRFTKPVKGKDIYLVQAFYNPNNSLIEAIFAAYTARELGAKSVGLVAPYMCYMREDKRFHPGEAISARIVAKLLHSCIDSFYTIDPHLHRFHSLREVFKVRSKNLGAAPLLSEFVKKNYKHPVIIGPDEESYQWALEVARPIGCKAAVLKKQRFGDYNVKVSMPEGIDVEGKQMVIVDDIVSSGQTMIETIKNLRKLGARDIICIAVHGVFAHGAYRKMKKAGAKHIYSTNTITHPSNRIDVSGLIAEALK